MTVFALAAASLLGGCSPRERADEELWTLFDVYQALLDNRPIVHDILPPTSVLTMLPDGRATLTVTPCFAEGKPAAFVTTELWYNFAQHPWVQPIYAQVGADAAAPLLIDVGPDSHFYSPFWRLDTAAVGDKTYRSTRDLFADNVPIARGADRTCPLHPTNVLPAPEGGHLVHPLWPQIQLADIPSPTVAIDGRETHAFDFGPRLFDEEDPEEYGFAGLVEPIPFFMFVDGSHMPIDAYRVGAVGPLFSGKSADVEYVGSVADGTRMAKPRFGGYWRVFFVELPDGAGAYSAAAAAAADTSSPAHAAYVAAQEQGIDLLEYDRRVALDKSCFDSTAFPGSCFWLDSQAAIEGALGSASMIETPITGTCPFVFYDKMPVAR